MKSFTKEHLKLISQYAKDRTSCRGLMCGECIFHDLSAPRTDNHCSPLKYYNGPANFTSAKVHISARNYIKKVLNNEIYTNDNIKRTISVHSANVLELKNEQE